jgi:hypothetical protein
MAECPERKSDDQLGDDGNKTANRMIEPRKIVFEPAAVSALFEILNIMTDQLMEGNMLSRWDTESVVDLQMRLSGLKEGDAVEMGIDDAALLLDGMAFTEVMSVDFPFFEMVQWTSDFVTAELRSHWSEDLWLEYAGR